MIINRVNILLLSFTIFYISCSKSLDGKIEKRQSKCAGLKESHSSYLVNSSSNKKLTFTVKITETINDTTIEYTTLQKELEPGDEYLLGCDKEIGKKIFKEFDLLLQFDTIIYAKHIYSQETEFYCTKDTSLFNYKFNYILINEDKYIFDKSLVKQTLLEKEKTTLKDFLPKSKLFIGIPYFYLKKNESLTKENGKLTASLKCTDLNETITDDVYKYKFEITGQSENKEKETVK